MRQSAGFGAFLLCVLGTVSASAQAQPPLPPVRPPELSLRPKSYGAPPAAPAAARAVIASRRAFSPASGRRRSVPRGIES